MPRSVSTFAGREALSALMKEAGFERISQHPMTFGVCVASLGVKPRSPDLRLSGREAAESVR